MIERAPLPAAASTDPIGYRLSGLIGQGTSLVSHVQQYNYNTLHEKPV